MVNNTKRIVFLSNGVSDIGNIDLLGKPDDVWTTIDHYPKVSGVQKIMRRWLVGEYRHADIYWLDSTLSFL